MCPVHRLRMETFKGALKLSRKHSYGSKTPEKEKRGRASGVEGRRM